MKHEGANFFFLLKIRRTIVLNLYEILATGRKVSTFVYIFTPLNVTHRVFIYQEQHDGIIRGARTANLSEVPEFTHLLLESSLYLING